MQNAVFLSASVPDPYSKNFIRDADTVAVASAVRALIFVILGRKPLVWGGHPSITPMIWSVAEQLKTSYTDWVKLYQSTFFEDIFPEHNNKFENVEFVDQVGGERDSSLYQMRTRMFHDNSFSTSIFIGGMKGVVDEAKLLSELSPETKLIPILSTGGATQEVLQYSKVNKELRVRLETDVDYVLLFHNLCEIPFDLDRSKTIPPTHGLVNYDCE